MGLTVTERVLAYSPGRERKLWDEYLRICRAAYAYEDVEPWAWTLLQQELRWLPKAKTA